MNVKKKICKLFCTVLCLLLVLGITGCGNEGEEPVQPVTELSDEAIEELHSSLKTTNGGYGFYFNEAIDAETITAEILLPYIMAEYADANDIDLSVQNLYTFSDYESFSKDKGALEGFSKKEIDEFIKQRFPIARDFTPDVEHPWNHHDGSEVYLYEVPNFAAFFLYDVNDEMYYFVSVPRMNAISQIYQNFVKAEQTEDAVYIYDKPIIDMTGSTYHTISTAFKSGYLSEEDNQAYKDEYCLDSYNMKELPAYVTEDGEFDSEIAFDTFKSRIPTYKHTFKKADNGNYYWFASEIVEHGVDMAEDGEETSAE